MNRAKKTNTITIGNLLISEPFMLDETYKRSVILLAEENTKGISGFILNKPTDIKINNALEDFPNFDAPLYFGGPCEMETLFYIHTFGLKLRGSKEISSGLYIGGDFERLKFLIDTKQIDNNQIRFYGGFMGWRKNNLKREIIEKYWLHSPKVKQGFVFSNEPKKLWTEVLKSMGDEFKIIANFPEDPSLN